MALVLAGGVGSPPGKLALPIWDSGILPYEFPVHMHPPPKTASVFSLNYERLQWYQSAIKGGGLFFLLKEEVM